MKRKLIERKVHEYKGGLTKRILKAILLCLFLLTISASIIYIVYPKPQNKEPPTFIVKKDVSIVRFMTLDYENEFLEISRKQYFEITNIMCVSVYVLLYKETLDISVDNSNNTFLKLSDNIKESLNELKLSDTEKCEEEYSLVKMIKLIKILLSVLHNYRKLYDSLMRCRNSVYEHRISSSYLNDMEILLTHYSILDGFYTIKKLWTELIDNKLDELLRSLKLEYTDNDWGNLLNIKSKINYIFGNILEKQDETYPFCHYIDGKSCVFNVLMRRVKDLDLYWFIYNYYTYTILHLLFDNIHQTSINESKVSLKDRVESKAISTIELKEWLKGIDIKDENKAQKVSNYIGEIEKGISGFRRLREMNEDEGLLEKNTVLNNRDEIESMKVFPTKVLFVLNIFLEELGDKHI